MENMKPGWVDSVVMICRNCNEEAALRIKSEVKVLAREKFGKEVRIITTSCLGMCPENKIAIVKAAKNNLEFFEGHVIELETSSIDIFKNLLK